MRAERHERTPEADPETRHPAHDFPNPATRGRKTKGEHGVSGNKEYGSWLDQDPDRYQGETLQVFVFFKGRYLGYQCYVQERVTAGGSQNLDLYLPACNPEDGYWSFEICGGTLVAWLTPMGAGGAQSPKPARKAVEPLDVFPLGPYRLQVKILQAAGFMDQYADLAAEPICAGAKEAEPGEQGARPEPESFWADSGTTRSQTPIQQSLQPTFQGTYLEETPGDVQDEALTEPPTPCEETRISCEPALDSAQTAQALPAATQEQEPFDPVPGLAQEQDEKGQEASTPEPLCDETDDESAPSGPYFSLLREIFRSCRTAAPIADPAQRALEIVRFRGGDLRDVAYLEEEGSYTLRKEWTRNLWKKRGGPRPNFCLVSLAKNGDALLHIREGVTGRLHSRRSSRKIPDPEAPDSGREAGRARKGNNGASIGLPPDAWVVLRVDPYRYLVRHVAKRPGLPIRPLRPRMTRSHAKILSASIVSHIVLILLVGLTVPKGTVGGATVSDRFAKVDPTLLEKLKKPEPPKPDRPIASPLPAPQTKPKVAPVPKPEPAKPAEAEKSRARSQEARTASGGERSAEPQKQVDVSQTGLLAALGSPSAAAGADSKSAGQTQVLLAAVTNLDAVAVPSDSTTFNLAGIAGKLVTSEIQVPTGAGEAIRTVGAQELLKNSQGTVGALASRGTGGGQVKAVVREPPKATISIRGGMSREAVLQVVNAHLDEIRDCYERELLHSPGLTGKIVLEWLIREDGSVSYAKVAFTNIGHSSDLHLCVQAQVTAWKFPRPTDGHEVVVTFPFLFENMGF
jgi:hypothetical protein